MFQKKIQTWLIAAFAAIYMMGCQPRPKQTEVDENSNPLPEVNLNRTEEFGDFGSPAPVLIQSLVLAQTNNLTARTAVITGRPGFTGEAGVTITEVCGRNTEWAASAPDFCFDTVVVGEDLVSVAATISDTDPGDVISMWGNGPTYAPGGAENDIKERVLDISTALPSVVTAYETLGSSIYFGGSGGLYEFASTAFTNIELGTENLPPNPSKRFTSKDSQLPDINVSALRKRGTELWVGTGDGVAKMTKDETGQAIFEHYGVEVGIPNRIITTLEVDSSSDLWVGTATGLARLTFDENENFTVSNYNVGNVTALSYDSAKNRIWIGTEAGIAYVGLSGGAGNVISEDFPTDNTTSLVVGSNTTFFGTATGVKAVVVDEEGNFVSSSTITTPFVQGLALDNMNQILWVATIDGVKAISTNGAPAILDMANLPSGNIHSITHFAGKVWASKERTMLQISEAEERFEVTSIAHTSTIPNNSIRAIIPGNHGDFWIGTDYGLSRMTFKEDGEEAGNPVFQNYFKDDNTRLPANGIRALMLDSHKQLWIGTQYSGLARLPLNVSGNPVFPSATYIKPARGPGMADMRITALQFQEMPAETGEKDVVWAGTRNGLSRIELVEETGMPASFVNYNAQLPMSSVTSLALEPSGSVWIGTEGGPTKLTYVEGTAQFQTMELPTDAVTSLSINSEGTVFLGTNAVGVRKITFTEEGVVLDTFNTESGLSSNDAISTAIDANGKLYVASADAGMDKLTFSPDRTPEYQSLNSFLPTGQLLTIGVGLDLILPGTVEGLIVLPRL